MAYQSVFNGTRIAPLPLMGAGAALALLLILSALVFIERQPWLGLGVDYDNESGFPIVSVVYEPQHAAGSVRQDSRLTAIISDRGDRISLEGFDPTLEPSGFAHFDVQKHYFERSTEITEVLAEGASLEVDGEHRVPVSLAKGRGLDSLPADFWLLNLFGLLVWAIGLSVFAARPGERAARMLCLSSAGFYVSCLFNSIYVCRELAMSGETLASLSAGNRTALLVMLFAILALMARFPGRITRRPPELYLTVAFCLVLVNEWQQLVDLPVHSFFLPVYIMYAAGIAIAFVQWRKTRNYPVDRAALKWMLLAVFIIMGTGLVIYYIPITVRGSPLLPEWGLVAVASLLYVGFALGIIRYRLFQVDRWWLTIWIWFLGGLSIVLVDMALIAYLKVQPPVALMGAVIFVGWLYFPVRQWAWEGLTGGKGRRQHQLVRMVEEIAGAVPSGEVNDTWQSVLTRSFDPASIQPIENRVSEVRLGENGTRMDVPLLEHNGALRLFYAHGGKRLFSTDDREYAENLFQVSRRILRVHQAEMEAVQQERQRIVRDLHDDVGGQLLSLLRQAPDDYYGSLARNALQSLRESMKAIDNDAIQDASGCIDDWQAEAEERPFPLGVNLDWSKQLNTAPLQFSVRQAINLRRILFEAISNALQHASPRRISVYLKSDDNYLELTLVNDGVDQSTRHKGLLRGRGLNNMQTRASELGGMSEFSIDGEVANVRTVIPIIP